MTGAPGPMSGRRLLLLRRDAAFNGVDYAERHDGHVDVHFINRVRVRGRLAEDRPPVTLAVSGAAAAPAAGPVDEDVDWLTDTSGRPVLRVTADIPDAPARYLLTVHSDRVDPCLSSAAFTVRGRDDIADCGAPPPAGQPAGGQAVAVDYLAKDFASFLQALSGFSAARYPMWAERSEADLGIMLMELLSAMADELSYLQDRVAAESALGTATQRLSLVRHARLVDYEPAPAMAAATVLQVDVRPSAVLPALIGVQAVGGPDGTVDFTAGAPLPGWEALAGDAARPAPDARWNRYDQAGRPRLRPYRWDGPALLRRGATSLWIEDHGHGLYPGQRLLIDTPGTDGDPPAREIVLVTAAEEHSDPVRGQPVTLIRWRDGLTSDHDLRRTEIAGNLLPVVQGRFADDELFAIPGGAPDGVPLATVRAGHDATPAHCLYTLRRQPAWLPEPVLDGGPSRPRPALVLDELAAGQPGPAQQGPGGPGTPAARAAWQWVPRLLDADGTAAAFTVTPERYSAAVSVNGVDFRDYDGDGATVRFGDGTFGRPPVPGTTFRARYLAGGGESGNVAADTILTVAPGDPAYHLVLRCTNPFPAAGGTDAETHAQIRDRAPQQVGAGLLSLTGPADYQQAALTYRPDGAAGTAWARQAAAAVRWTGSWPSVLTVVDPQLDDLPAPRLAALAELLSTRRLAGTDTAVAVARYRRLDLRVTCRARLGYRPGAVEAAVLARLAPQEGADGTTGFFGRDRWTFGQPLEASALVAAVQSCPGVAGVSRVDYRPARGPGEWRPLRATLPVAPGEILRVGNDQGRPGHGLLFVTAEAAR